VTSLLTRRSSLCGGVALGVTPSAFAQRFAWPHGAVAAVSLSYDDGLDSQIAYAAPALDSAGLKATFFLTKDNVGPALGDWRRLARSGHEIGDHTVSHPCAIGGYSSGRFARDELLPMEDWLDLNFGRSGPRVFAYPCSVTDLGPGNATEQRARYEALLRTIGFRAARTCDGDAPNTLSHVRTHPYRLRASAVTYEVDEPTPAMEYVRQAMEMGGWAILVFHEIKPEPTVGGDTSVATHDAVLGWLKSQPVWCAPIGTVLGAIEANKDGPAQGARSPSRRWPASPPSGKLITSGSHWRGSPSMG